MFSPSERLCVDERFRIWYFLRGYWINLSISHYVHMDFKTYDGYKIQDTCCGRSMVMLKLNLLKIKVAD